MSGASDTRTHMMIILNQVINLKCMFERHSRLIKKFAISLGCTYVIEILFIYLKYLSDVHFNSII
jgi:hypothetical protein